MKQFNEHVFEILKDVASSHPETLVEAINALSNVPGYESEVCKIIELSILNVGMTNEITEIVLTNVPGITDLGGSNYIRSIKDFRSITNFGLKEAKEFIDSIKSDQEYSAVISFADIKNNGKSLAEFELNIEEFCKKRNLKYKYA